MSATGAKNYLQRRTMYARQISQGIADHVSMQKKVPNLSSIALMNAINGVKTILDWLQHDLENAKPIKYMVHRHCDQVIQNTHKCTCWKNKDKKNDFNTFVTGMMEWLRKNPKK